MNYITPLSDYKFNLQSKKLEGLARLVKLKIPTVSNLFIVSPKLYQEFLQTKKLSNRALIELKQVFFSVRKQGYSITLRNSIYEEKNPGIAFSVHNSLNLKLFTDFHKRITQGYKKAMKMAINPQKVEFAYLIQSFYSSEKCGTLLSNNNNNQIYLQAIFGQHTNLLLRGDIEPDKYTIAKKTYKIIKKKIALKKFRIKKLSTSIKKIRVKVSDQKKSVLDNTQVVKLAKLSQVVERVFGPQEMEWAVLDSGKIIFQETRDFEQAGQVLLTEKADVIFPAQTQGEVINLKKVPNKNSVSGKIVVTSNLNIGFINKLAFLYRPKAIILTKGSITSHAATVLRESKITTVLIRNIKFKDGEKIQIEKNGDVQKIL